jgi:hypothetical protein
VLVRRAVFAPWFSIVFVVLVASCQDSTPVEVRVVPAISGTPLATAPTVIASARRPTLRNILTRTAERCEVYSIDGERVSPAERTPCPQDLEVGERIRVTGKTCIREGKPERRRPVVCPGPLLLREQRDGGTDASLP